MDTLSRVFWILMLWSCGTPLPGPAPRVCDTSAAASLTLTLSSSDGQPLPNVKATWKTAEQSDSCQNLNNQFICGYEVAGNMTVEISAEGFQPQTLVVEIPKGDCHVVSQTRNVVLKPSVHFPSIRHFVHRHFPTEGDCQKMQPGGIFIHCCALATFRPNGESFLMFTDIANAGTYVRDEKQIVVTATWPGDAPEVVTFTLQNDGQLKDDAQNWLWIPSTQGACYQ